MATLKRLPRSHFVMFSWAETRFKLNFSGVLRKPEGAVNGGESHDRANNSRAHLLRPKLDLYDWSVDLSNSKRDYSRHWLATTAYTSVRLKHIHATTCNSSANADSPWHAHQAVPTFSASQNQSRIGHVIAQVDVCSSTENASSFLQRDIGFNRNSVRPNHRPVGTSLALDLTTLCIPARGKHE